MNVLSTHDRGGEVCDSLILDSEYESTTCHSDIWDKQWASISLFNESTGYVIPDGVPFSIQVEKMCTVEVRYAT